MGGASSVNASANASKVNPSELDSQSLRPEDDSSLLTSSLGLTVQFVTKSLLPFLSQQSGIDLETINQMTLRELCDRCVLPFTAQSGLSFVEALQSFPLADNRNELVLRKAQVFVCVCWRSRIRDIWDALRCHYKRDSHQQTSLWMDVFSANQQERVRRHIAGQVSSPAPAISGNRLSFGFTSEKEKGKASPSATTASPSTVVDSSVAQIDAQWWLGPVRDGISTIGRTVLIMSPSIYFEGCDSKPVDANVQKQKSAAVISEAEPPTPKENKKLLSPSSTSSKTTALSIITDEDESPLRSSRILWGLFCTAESQNAFSIAMSDGEKNRFIAQLTENATACVDSLLSQVDIMNCSYLGERASILVAVQQSVGVGAFNARIGELLRDWAIGFVSSLLPSTSGSVKISHHTPDACLEEEPESPPEDQEAACAESAESGATLTKPKSMSSLTSTLKDCSTGASSSYIDCAPINDWSLLSLKVALAQLYLSKGLAESADVVVRDSLETLRALELQEGVSGKHVVASKLANQQRSLSKVEPLRAISRLMQTRHKLDDAEELLLEAMDSVKEAFGENDEHYFAICTDLSRIYLQRMNHEKAETLLQTVLDRRTQLYGDNDPRTLNTMHEVAQLYEASRKFDTAEILYRDCLSRRTKTMGENAPETLQSMNNLASALYGRGKYEEALKLFKECWTRKTNVHGESHPETLTAMNNLGVVYKEMKKYDEAEKLYLDCLMMRREVLGEGHPLTLQSIANLASLIEAQGRPREACHLYTECLRMRIDHLGATHPDTERTKRQVARLKQSFGETEG